MCLFNSNLDMPETISIISQLVEEEQVLLASQKIIYKEFDCLKQIQKVAHLKSLLSLLRRCDYRQPS